ncbi:putative HTH-type transcriptional regulator YybR [compost metagenome]
MHRFNELRRAIPGVTQHMLTQQLRELENDGMVRRTVYPEIPPRVEYQITEDARRLKPVFEAILMWSHARGGGERGVEDAAAWASIALKRAEDRLSMKVDCGPPPSR